MSSTRLIKNISPVTSRIIAIIDEIRPFGVMHVLAWSMIGLVPALGGLTRVYTRWVHSFSEWKRKTTVGMNGFNVITLVVIEYVSCLNTSPLKGNFKQINLNDNFVVSQISWTVLKFYTILIQH